MNSIEDIIIGKWYSRLGERGNVSAKVIGINENTVLFTEYLYNTGIGKEYYKVKTTRSIFYSINNTRLSSQEHLDKYLPSSHPDRFTSKKNEDLTNNNKQNGKNSNNKVCGSNINEPKSKGRGKITISSGGQSVSTGSRPKGNKASANYCRAQVSSVKIIRRAIISGHN